MRGSKKQTKMNRRRKKKRRMKEMAIKMARMADPWPVAKATKTI